MQRPTCVATISSVVDQVHVIACTRFGQVSGAKGGAWGHSAALPQIASHLTALGAELNPDVCADWARVALVDAIHDGITNVVLATADVITRRANGAVDVLDNVGGAEKRRAGGLRIATIADFAVTSS